MTTQPIDSIETPQRHAWLPHVLGSAATLVALGLIAVVLLRPSDRAPEPSPAAPVLGQEAAATTRAGSTAAVERGGLAEMFDDQSIPASRAGSAAVEKGGLAELYDDLGQAKTPARRVTVYLVANEAQAQELDRTRTLSANFTGGVPTAALILTTGSPEEEARADAILRELDLSAHGDEISVVDLRGLTSPE